MFSRKEITKICPTIPIYLRDYYLLAEQCSALYTKYWIRILKMRELFQQETQCSNYTVK